MSMTTNLAFRFLRELHSSDIQETFEALDSLLEHLENKDDPDPAEVQIVDSAYQTLEKLKLLEGLLKNYVGESGVAKGNQLEKLYKKTPIDVGSQSFFD